MIDDQDALETSARPPEHGEPQINLDEAVPTLVPAAPAHDAGDARHGRAVTQVTGGGPIAYGEAVQFEFEFADGSREKFHATVADLPKIVGNLRGYASLAERSRRATADKPVEVVNPYQATDARTDRLGPMIVVRLSTTDGLPLLVAMDATVAGKLVRDVERELARPPRGFAPPPRR